jgi:hypothetical protein
MARHIKQVTNTESEDKETSFDVYSSLIKQSQEGMTLDQMESRLAIMGKLAKANGTLVLEDAEWKSLDDCLKSQKWLVASQFVVDLCKAVSDAEQKEAK